MAGRSKKLVLFQHRVDLPPAQAVVAQGNHIGMPLSKINWALPGSMPLPTAEFSPFTMVNLRPSSRFKPGSIWRRQSQPCRATTSPMVKIFTCTPFLSDAGSGVIAEILYYIPVVITRMGLKFNTFATFEYSGAYMVLPVVYSFDKLCGRLRGDAASYPTSWVCKVGGFTYAFYPSVAQAPAPLKNKWVRQLICRRQTRRNLAGGRLPPLPGKKNCGGSKPPPYDLLFCLPCVKALS